MSEKQPEWNLLKDGVPPDLKKGEYLGKGDSKEVWKTNYPDILLAEIFDKKIKSELKILEHVRVAVEKNKADFPLQIPITSLESGKTAFITKNYGITLKNIEKFTTTKTHLINFLINQIRLSGNRGISNDNHLGNITFDNINGLRLIDINFSLFASIDDMFEDIRRLNDTIKENEKWLFDTMKTNQYICKLCQIEISLVSPLERQEVIQFLEQLLEEEKEKESSEKRSFGE